MFDVYWEASFYNDDGDIMFDETFVERKLMFDDTVSFVDRMANNRPEVKTHFGNITVFEDGKWLIPNYPFITQDPVEFAEQVIKRDLDGDYDPDI